MQNQITLEQAKQWMLIMDSSSHVHLKSSYFQEEKGKWVGRKIRKGFLFLIQD